MNAGIKTETSAECERPHSFAHSAFDFRTRSRTPFSALIFRTLYSPPAVERRGSLPSSAFGFRIQIPRKRVRSAECGVPEPSAEITVERSAEYRKSSFPHLYLSAFNYLIHFSRKPSAEFGERSTKRSTEITIERKYGERRAENHRFRIRLPH